eukprot:2643842-Prymnesium_polylepis.2
MRTPKTRFQHVWIVLRRLKAVSKTSMRAKTDERITMTPQNIAIIFLRRYWPSHVQHSSFAVSVMPMAAPSSPVAWRAALRRVGEDSGATKSRKRATPC